MPKSIDIIDEFHFREGELFTRIANEIQENCEIHNLNILNKNINSSSDFAFELAELVLNNCDINFYISSYRKRAS